MVVVWIWRRGSRDRGCPRSGVEGYGMWLTEGGVVAQVGFGQVDHGDDGLVHTGAEHGGSAVVGLYGDDVLPCRQVSSVECVGGAGEGCSGGDAIEEPDVVHGGGVCGGMQSDRLPFAQEGVVADVDKHTPYDDTVPVGLHPVVGACAVADGGSKAAGGVAYVCRSGSPGKGGVSRVGVVVKGLEAPWRYPTIP
jgi:hypothetical protein